MNMLTLLQEFSPAQVMVALFAFPWLAVALMHAFAAITHRRLDARAFDGTLPARAAAARKWFVEKPKAGLERADARTSKRAANAAKTRRLATAVREFRVHRGTPPAAVAPVPAELDAA